MTMVAPDTMKLWINSPAAKKIMREEAAKVQAEREAAAVAIRELDEAATLAAVEKLEVYRAREAAAKEANQALIAANTAARVAYQELGGVTLRCDVDKAPSLKFLKSTADPRIFELCDALIDMLRASDYQKEGLSYDEAATLQPMRSAASIELRDEAWKRPMTTEQVTEYLDDIRRRCRLGEDA